MDISELLLLQVFQKEKRALVPKNSGAERPGSFVINYILSSQKPKSKKQLQEYKDAPNGAKLIVQAARDFFNEIT